MSETPSRSDEGNEDPGWVHTADDGFGNVVECRLGLSGQVCCLEVVRPGKFQCLCEDKAVAPIIEAVRALPSEKAPQQWVPVGERFPKGKDAVICLVYTPTDGDGDESLGGVLLATHTDDGWMSRTDTGCWEPGDVTHWMPLPEAPK